MEKLSVNSHKIFLILLKYTPAILAVGYFLSSILQCFDIDAYIMTYLVSVGIIPLVFLLVSSIVFKFCEYHRIYIYYIILNEILNIVDYNTELIGSNVMYVRMHVILFFVATLITTILYLYERKNKNTTRAVTKSDK